MLGSYRSRWEDNMKVGVKGKERDGVHWIFLTQGRDK
jgi:hypothetical protein